MDQTQSNDDTFTPVSLLEGSRMDRVIRHRLRNFCAGMKMAVSSFQERPEQPPAERERCSLMMAELNDLLRFSDRMGLAWGPPPPPEPRMLNEVISTLQDEFARQFPFCSLEAEGEYGTEPFPKGNWLAIVLRELLWNAAEAAGRNGQVRFFWKQDPVPGFGVMTMGANWSPEVPRFPFRPFHTTRGRHDGLGLAIAQRYCQLLELDLTMPEELPDTVFFLLS